jgi:transposase
MDIKTIELVLNLPSLKVESIEVTEKTIRINCEQKVHKGTCPKCQKEVVKVNQYSHHKLRDLDISGRQVVLDVRVAQLLCVNCHHYFNEVLDFAEPNKGFTKRQSKWIFDLSVKLPHTEVGALLDVNAKTVERIFYAHTSPVDDFSRYQNVKRLGIDELSFSKGKNDYICALTNLDTGQTLDILRSRKKEDLIAHFTAIKLEKGSFLEQIEAISCDFWGPFMDIAKKLFPNAVVVGDRFHWTGYLNEAINKLRKALRKEFPDEKVFKKIKWALFKQHDKASEQDKELLQNAFALSPLLKQMYELKTQLQRLFNQDLKWEIGVEKVNEWVLKCKKLQENYFDDFLAFLDRNFDTITNFFKQKISNAATEGNNNLLRTVKRMTFNMTNFAHFKARCFAFKT